VATGEIGFNLAAYSGEKVSFSGTILEAAVGAWWIG
tara:strand:- start:156 stop:263 length:108 start_codon:yes stop_codon:yes gene_type:complete